MTLRYFFLGEYANMILMSGMTAVLFLADGCTPIDIAPFNWIPGPIWFALNRGLSVHFPLGPRDVPPLSLLLIQLIRLGWKSFLAAVAALELF